MASLVNFVGCWLLNWQIQAKVFKAHWIDQLFTSECVGDELIYVRIPDYPVNLIIRDHWLRQLRLAGLM